MNVKKFAWYIVVLALLQPAVSRRKSKGKCYGEYTCQRPTVSDGSTKCICINPSQFCNGATDCPNGEDEQNCDRTWAGWMNWNDCSRSCGGGHRVRYRTCNPGKGQDCTGKAADVANCGTQDCPDRTWAGWMNWNNCSRSCGGGHRVRYRTCNPGKGSDCIGKSADVANCGTQDCPVNGGWSSWPAWGDCDKTCGGGTRTRVRACTCPPQSGGGSNCIGNDTEQTSCAMNGCPVDGEWTNWSDCPCIGESCPGSRRKRGDSESDGRKTRYRSCTMPRPSLGGAYCSGEPVEEDVPCTPDFEDCSGGGRRDG